MTGSREPRSEQGNSLVEFALALPLLLLLTIGLLQAGLLGYGSLLAGEAARPGARMGSVVQGNAAAVAQAEAWDLAQAAFPAAVPHVQVLAPGGVPGSELTLEVVYEIPNLFSRAGLTTLFSGLPSASTLEVKRRVTFRQEGW